MSANIPSSYDMLSLYGVLPYDVNQMLFDTPSPYLQQHGVSLPNSSPEKDEFKHGEKEKKEKEPIEPKKLGLIALATYLTGVVLSKGSKNPVKGMEAIGKTLWNIVKIPIRVIKK